MKLKAYITLSLIMLLKTVPIDSVNMPDKLLNCPRPEECPEGQVALELNEEGSHCSHFICGEMPPCGSDITFYWESANMKCQTCDGPCQDLTPPIDKMNLNCLSELVYRAHGEQWDEDNSCSKCTCVFGEKQCTIEACSPPDCDNPVRLEGICCPTCLPPQENTTTPSSTKTSGTSELTSGIETSFTTAITESNIVNASASSTVVTIDPTIELAENATTAASSSTTGITIDLTTELPENDASTAAYSSTVITTDPTELTENETTSASYSSTVISTDYTTELSTTDSWLNISRKNHFDLQVEGMPEQPIVPPEIDFADNADLQDSSAAMSVNAAWDSSSSTQGKLLLPEATAAPMTPTQSTTAAPIEHAQITAIPPISAATFATSGPPPSYITPESNSYHKDSSIKEADYRMASAGFISSTQPPQKQFEINIEYAVIAAAICLLICAVSLVYKYVLIKKSNRVPSANMYSSVPNSDSNISETRTERTDLIV